MQNGSADAMDSMLQRAAAEQHAQQVQTMMLQSAVQNPHTIERVEQSAIGLARDASTGAVLLLVATPDGKRRDIKLSPDSLRLLRRVLAELDGETGD